MARALTRWEPFAEFADLHTRLNRMFDEVAGAGEREWMPAIDVVEDNGNLVMHADLPGIKPGEVKIQIEDDVLTLSGKHEEHTEAKDASFVRRERRYGAFSRSIALPAGVDAKKVKARTTDGVLEVTIPLPKEAKNERVEITPTAG